MTNKDNTTWWIIGAVVLILLIGGGVGIWYYMKKSITITISPMNTNAAQGDIVAFSAIVKEAGNAKINTQVTWSSSDKSLGIIDQSGVFTALGNNGKVMITATSVEDSSKSATSTVSLGPGLPDYIGVDKKITANDPLYSKDKSYHATTLNDGKFCIRKKDNTDKWCSIQDAKPNGDYYTKIQDDGNLCTYLTRKDGHPDAPVWCNYKFSTTKDNYGILQNDGRICTNKGKDPKNSLGELWCSP